MQKIASMKKNEYLVVGMMSGTSLDGLDLVLCRFRKEGENWQFRVEKAATIEYTAEWKARLNDAFGLSAPDLLQLHCHYGRFIGNNISEFLSGFTEPVDLVASHGHTVFHQPEQGFTFQLGEGSALASGCNLLTVSDFRTMDVALGGQGAPLVPIGDELLFGEYRYCLNLGGFANVSTNKTGLRVACDICPVNIVANNLAMRAGFEFDNEGEMGSRGDVEASLVTALNNLGFYSRKGPKSLGREWVENEFMPVIQSYNIPLESLIRSAYEHMAVQIAAYVNEYGTGNMLVTGGGAFNTFLIGLIKSKTEVHLIIPDEGIVKFKEAIIFAFLGLLRYREEINCLASVTGASRNSSSGAIHIPA